MRALADPAVRLFTVEEYHRMGEAGVFGPDERVELIRGVIHKMSPKGRRHSAAVSLLNDSWPDLQGAAGSFRRTPFAYKNGTPSRSRTSSSRRTRTR